MSAVSGTRALPRSTNGNLRKDSAKLTITPGTSKTFLTKENLNIIEESCRARLLGKTGQYRQLKREAVRALRRDKEAQIHESARQWKATYGQLTLDLPTEKSRLRVSLGPRPAVLQ